MPEVKITPSWKWDCVSGGGVFIGVRWSFPALVTETPEARLIEATFGTYEVRGAWQQAWWSMLTFGFGLGRLSFEFCGKFREMR